jgi:hypothetical protein
VKKNEDIKGVIRSRKSKDRQTQSSKEKERIVVFPFIFWSLCCLTFNLWLLITPLVSSEFSGFFLKQTQAQNRKYTTSKLKHLFYRKVSFVTGNHSNFPGVGQDVNNIYHYL